MPLLDLDFWSGAVLRRLLRWRLWLGGSRDMFRIARGGIARLGAGIIFWPGASFCMLGGTGVCSIGLAVWADGLFLCCWVQFVVAGL